MVFHGFWLVSKVFQGGFVVFHGFWLVSMVFHGSRLVFHGFSPESTCPKLYPGPTIQSRSAARRAAQDLVYIKQHMYSRSIYSIKIACARNVIPKGAGL